MPVGQAAEVKIIASDAARWNHFGRSVSIDRDTAIVGAYANGDAGFQSGSAYIFVHRKDNWVQRAELTPKDAAAGDWFGLSVSLSGDTAIVEAWGDDDAGENSGSVYIFVRSGDTWTQQTKLTASDATAGDQFGRAVSLNGEVVIAGARWNDDVGENSGSAYIFVWREDTWTQQAKLTASDAAAGAKFGESVSLSRDAAIVGAPGDDDAVEGTGSAYIFEHDGDTWTQQAKLTASDAAA